VGGQDHGPAFLESGFPERIRAYMSKARHEAKQNTSWINPNVAYDKAADEFVAAALDPERSRGFLRDVDGFVRTIVKPGLWNSLSQVILKISSPGIPDFFQGTELWDFSLVDPDNRRLVDFEARRRRLTELLAAFQERGAEAVASWFESPDDGAIKLWLTAAALRTRRTHRAVFDRGAYVPLEVRGPSAEHALAFARVEGDAAVVTVVGRFFSRLRGPRPTGAAWGENQLVLPPALGGRPWRDTLTGQPVPTASRDGRLDLAAVFQTLPVALLEVAS
jgi:(1->4)-alpha-D-glucan 1-alpha-D-glucosylmutase